MEKLTQDFIEKYIHLIDKNDFDELFYKCIHESNVDITDLRYVLEECNIEPLDYIDYIPMGYFLGDQNLIEIILPNDTQSIHADAFHYCDSLEKISLPNTLYDIGERSLSYCGSLKYIELPNSLEFIHSNAFEASNIQKCRYLGTIDQFKEIEFGDLIFFDCPLKHIDCDDGIIEIDENGEPII